MPTLRGVTLDLWRTLMEDTQEVGRARFQYRMGGIQAILVEAGVAVDADQLRTASRACFRACEGIRGLERELSFTDQVDLFMNLVEPGLATRLSAGAKGRIREVYGAMPSPHTPTVAPGAVEVLRALRDEGYALALISNTGVTPGATLRGLLADLELLPHLNVLVFSDEVGMVKPAEGIFRLALERMGVAAPEAAHVGDHPKADVLGGNRAGMWTVQVASSQEREQVAEPHVRIPVLAELPGALERI
ncbi:MAG: HAD-IA family hydrolase, partial [SAR202 cluster bacterium]|nr:HAD-IA family hydrolase [SAR202 cluster bacterium]